MPVNNRPAAKSASIPPAQAALAEAMHLIRPLTRIGYHRRTGDLARKLNMSLSTYYRAFDGYSSKANLVALYSAAQRGSAGQPMPISLEALEAFWERAAEERRVLHAKSVLASSSASPVETPADNDPWPGSVNVNVPVPSGLGDRQVLQTPWWPGMADEDTASLLGVLHHLGFEGAPAETAAAIASCYDKGLLAEAETILSYAARRSEMDIIGIARDLLSAGCQAGARAILDFKLTQIPALGVDAD